MSLASLIGTPALHSENYNKYDSYERQSSKYDNHGRQSGQRVSVRQQDSSTDRQNTRDRQERETGTGGKTGGSQRWSSVSRGSVSPGKENCDTIGYRYIIGRTDNMYQ